MGNDVVSGNEISTIIEQYINEIRDINDCFKVYIRLHNLCHFEKNQEANIAPIFFSYTLNSLLVFTIIGLAKLYEGHNGRKRSDRNIKGFLDLIEVNIDKFDISLIYRKKINCEYEVNIDLVNEHRSYISNKSQLIDQLVLWRDKFFAHNDKEYFRNLDALIKTHPILIGELRSLIELFYSTVNTYSIALDGVNYSLDSFENIYDVEEIFRLISLNSS